MNNPVTVNCLQGTWTKIATGVKNICIWRSDKSPAAYLMTYRISGGAAPSSQLEGQPLFLDNYYERIQSALKYLLRITNLSTDTNYVNVGMSWYENGI